MKTSADLRPSGGQTRATPLSRALAVTLLLSLLACGGSGGVDSGGTGIAPATLAVGPISGFGSIVVGGVHYDETNAVIKDGDGQTLPASALTLGTMTRIDATEVVTVGTRQEARAQTIHVEEVLTGPVESVDTAAMTATVLGQRVSVTSGTVFETSLGGGLAALRAGAVVAVYGQMDSAGSRVVATRIEPRTNVTRFVLRGAVRSLDRTAQRLGIGALAVNLAEAGSLPASLAVGSSVRLKLRTAAVAGVWSASDLRLDGLVLPDRSNVELEGRVTAFTSAQRFSVDGVQVDATAASASGGTIALGARVEVEGSSSNGVLMARRVSVEDEEGSDKGSIELEGRISALDTTARTFVLRGVTVSYANVVTFEGGSAADLALNRMVSVKGRLAADRSQVEASSIEFER